MILTRPRALRRRYVSPFPKKKMHFLRKKFGKTPCQNGLLWKAKFLLPHVGGRKCSEGGV